MVQSVGYKPRTCLAGLPPAPPPAAPTRAAAAAGDFVVVQQPLLPRLALIGGGQVRVDVMRVHVERDQAQRLELRRINWNNDADGGDVRASAGADEGTAAAAAG